MLTLLMLCFPVESVIVTDIFVHREYIFDIFYWAHVHTVPDVKPRSFTLEHMTCKVACMLDKIR